MAAFKQASSAVLSDNGKYVGMFRIVGFLYLTKDELRKIKLEDEFTITNERK